MKDAFDVKTGKCKCIYRCGFTWISIKLLNTGKLPKECPQCKSPSWTRPNKHWS